MSRARVLHLAFEDPRCPGAGGGSIRTREINRHLAEQFDITVVTATYRGAHPREEDGVRWVHTGVGRRPLNLLTYFATIPVALRRFRDTDLVVEDFAAPFGSVGVPHLTRRPVVGIVQWLYAKQKTEQYHLPFGLVEDYGLRSHDDLVVVSEGLAAPLRARAPHARVTVVPNGLEPEAFRPRSIDRRDLVFLGRLEIGHKGIDLLLEGFALAANKVDADLHIVGDGPDLARVRVLVAELGLADRVHLDGRVHGAARFDVLAGAVAVVMPSRYESFGMVAAEAQAVGTPVVAFDIDCLRDLLDPTTLAAAYDVDALARRMIDLCSDPTAARVEGEAGRARVAGLRWAELAQQQAEVYLRALRRA